MFNICYQKIKKHYKYKLFTTVRVAIGITGYKTRTAFIDLSEEGVLTIFKNYAWNGADWPAIDTESIMAASLVHDALCQLVENNHLPRTLVKQINNIMITICEEKKMSKFRIKRVHWAINHFCNPHTTKKEQKIYYA